MHEAGDAIDRTQDPQAQAAIRAALARVLASEGLSAAPQLSAFLAFVVVQTLAGRAGELKGYTIAVEALGRPADFDPQTDPIVRVEAGRLRKALAQYYAGEGRSDPLRIAIPVGAYVPLFRRVPPPEPEIAQPVGEQPQTERQGELSTKAPESGPGGKRVLAAAWLALGGLMVLVALTVIQPALRRQGGSPSQNARPAAESSGRPPPAVLAVPVQPARPRGPLPIVSVTVADLSESDLADRTARFVRLVVDALARFDDVVVVHTGEADTARSVEPDYLFELSVSRDGDTIEGFGRLLAVGDGRVVWTTSGSNRPSEPSDASDLAERARRIAIRLAEPFGIIHADVRRSPPSLGMRCVFMAIDTRRVTVEADHLAARTCLHRLVAKQPDFHAAWAQLALLTLDEYVHGFNALPGPPLDRALAAALNATRLAPASARARQVMMGALFTRGAIAEALAAGQEALARNPYDPEIMADLGSRYVRLNRPAEGLPLLESAIALSAGRPPWYDFYASLAAHLLGARALADSHAAGLLAENSALSRIGRALFAVRRSDTPAAVAELTALGRHAPPFERDARVFLERNGFAQEVADRVVGDLGQDVPGASGPP